MIVKKKKKLNNDEWQHCCRWCKNYRGNGRCVYDEETDLWPDLNKYIGEQKEVFLEKTNNYDMLALERDEINSVFLEFIEGIVSTIDLYIPEGVSFTNNMIMNDPEQYYCERWE